MKNSHMRVAVFLAALLASCPALAQEKPPSSRIKPTPPQQAQQAQPPADPRYLQEALAVMQAQRNEAMDRVAHVSAISGSEIEKLKARVAELEAELEQAKKPNETPEQ